MSPNRVGPWLQAAVDPPELVAEPCLPDLAYECRGSASSSATYGTPVPSWRLQDPSRSVQVCGGEVHGLVPHSARSTALVELMEAIGR
jgi:hypothetical protein